MAPAALPRAMQSAVYAAGKGAHGIYVSSDRKMFSPGKLLIIKVLAAGINPVDYKLGGIPVVGTIMQGKGVGLDVCGEVVYSPAGCDFKVGDTGLSEYCECEPGKAAVKPAGLSAVQCAMLPVAGLTALQALRDGGNVKEKDEVLVIGASGGCGVMGVCLAKALGASVTAICSQKNEAFVKSLGADSVHCYDANDGPLPASRQQAFDCIFDTVTSPDDFNYEPTARPLLKASKDKMYVAINGGAGDWVRLLLGKALCLGNGLQRSGYRLLVTDQNSKDLSTVASKCVQHKIPLTLDEYSSKKPLFTLQASLDEAFQRLKSRRTRGKIVLASSEAVWADHFNTCGN